MTWSIVARDSATGALGIVVATKFFAVGARVPHIATGVGAVATQALVNPFYGTRGLRLLAEGVPAAEVIALLTKDDAGRGSRQVHLMDRAGRIAAHTGADCVEWCGHLVRDTFSVAGNMLAGAAVIEYTARAYEAGTVLPFPRRLIAAMKAGEAAGGDKRGRQSAALLIHGTQDYSDLDLRVDDHADPLAELDRLETVSRQHWTIFRQFMPSREAPAGVFDRAVINDAVAKAQSES